MHLKLTSTGPTTDGNVKLSQMSLIAIFILSKYHLDLESLELLESLLEMLKRIPQSGVVSCNDTNDTCSHNYVNFGAFSDEIR